MKFYSFCTDTHRYIHTNSDRHSIHTIKNMYKYSRIYTHLISPLLRYDLSYRNSERVKTKNSMILKKKKIKKIKSNWNQSLCSLLKKKYSKYLFSHCLLPHYSIQIFLYIHDLCTCVITIFRNNINKIGWSIKGRKKKTTHIQN